MLLNSLPAPKHKYDSVTDTTSSSQGNAMSPPSVFSSSPASSWNKNIPNYPNRANMNFIPLYEEDYADGGAYPEIHVVQYPLNMGRPGVKSSAMVAVNINEKGEVSYDALVKQGSNRQKLVQTSLDDIKNSSAISIEKVILPDTTEEQEVAEKTRLALEGLLESKIKSTKPSTIVQTNEVAEPTYIKYNPSGASTTGEQKIIRMVEAQVDPMEPPKHKTKRAPRGDASPPVPILHSPPRKLTVADQQAWKIPPCVSNWKNARGFTIPLDKRLAADGRGLQEVTINNKFAMLSEALYISERKAAEDLKIRNQIRKKMALQEKEDKEQELRDMALQARMDRSGVSTSATTGDMTARRQHDTEEEEADNPYADVYRDTAAPSRQQQQQKSEVEHDFSDSDDENKGDRHQPPARDANPRHGQYDRNDRNNQNDRNYQNDRNSHYNDSRSSAAPGGRGRGGVSNLPAWMTNDPKFNEKETDDTRQRKSSPHAAAVAAAAAVSAAVGRSEKPAVSSGRKHSEDDTRSVSSSESSDSSGSGSSGSSSSSDSSKSQSTRSDNSQLKRSREKSQSTAPTSHSDTTKRDESRDKRSTASVSASTSAGNNRHTSAAVNRSRDDSRTRTHSRQSPRDRSPHRDSSRDRQSNHRRGADRGRDTSHSRDRSRATASVRDQRSSRSSRDDSRTRDRRGSREEGRISRDERRDRDDSRTRGRGRDRSRDGDRTRSHRGDTSSRREDSRDRDRESGRDKVRDRGNRGRDSSVSRDRVKESTDSKDKHKDMGKGRDRTDSDRPARRRDDNENDDSKEDDTKRRERDVKQRDDHGKGSSTRSARPPSKDDQSSASESSDSSDSDSDSGSERNDTKRRTAKAQPEPRQSSSSSSSSSSSTDIYENDRENLKRKENELRAELLARQQRDKLRVEQRKERERELRLENMKGTMRKKKMDRDAERDVSEKIALGMHRGGGGQLGGESLFDSRLFNQSAGMDSGFGAEDDYGVYSKPLFARGDVSSVYRPKRDDADIYGDVDTQMAKLTDTTRFQPDKGFQGTEGGAVKGVSRSAPVQFEKAGHKRNEDEEVGGEHTAKSKKSRND